MGDVPVPGILPPFGHYSDLLLEGEEAIFMGYPGEQIPRVLQSPPKNGAAQGPKQVLLPKRARCAYCGTQTTKTKCENCGAAQ